MNIYITDRSTKLNKKMIEVIDEKKIIYIYIYRRYCMAARGYQISLRQIFLNVLQARKKYRCENLAAHRESHW